MRSDYTAEFESFSEQFTRAWYRFTAGLDTTLDLEPVFDRFGYLFTIEQIKELAAEADGAFTVRDSKAARYLRAAAIEEHFALTTRALDEAIADRDASATVALNGQDIPFLSIRPRLRSEPRAEVRRELSRKRDRVVEGGNDLRCERFEKHRDEAKALGAVSMAALWSEALGIDHASLAGRAGTLLPATEERYASTLATVLRDRVGVAIGDATRDDLAFALRLGDFDAAFPARRMTMVYRDLFAGFGIRTGSQENIRLDLEDRPSKSPRPFCSPIRVPDEVVLVVRPAGGFADFGALLHEGGHAQHFGFTSAGTHVAFARTGDRASSEVWAFLMQYLLLDPRFLTDTFGLGDALELRRVAALERCSMVRRHVAKLQYEEALLSGRTSLADAASAYVDCLGNATLVRVSRCDYLADLDDGFYVADYLRAWALEVLVRDYLRTRFGNHWWTSRYAGSLLKELWSTGFEYSADEIAAELGLGPIEFDPLADDLVEGLAA